MRLSSIPVWLFVPVGEFPVFENLVHNFKSYYHESSSFPVFAIEPVTTILYDSGHMIIITKGFSTLKYSYGRDRLIFEIRRRSSIARHLMKLRNKPRLSFAIETFNEPDPNGDYCIENSSKILRKFIVSCRGAIALRFDVTKEERRQIRRSRIERKGEFNQLVVLQTILCIYAV